MYCSTRDSNHVELSKDDFAALGPVVAIRIVEKIPEAQAAYDQWREIFQDRNNRYSTRWINLGFCHLFGTIYSKLYRAQETPAYIDEDAGRDIFGYMVMFAALASKIDASFWDKFELLPAGNLKVVESYKEWLWEEEFMALSNVAEAFFSVYLGFLKGYLHE